MFKFIHRLTISQRLKAILTIQIFVLTGLLVTYWFSTLWVQKDIVKMNKISDSIKMLQESRINYNALRADVYFALVLDSTSFKDELKTLNVLHLERIDAFNKNIEKAMKIDLDDENFLKNRKAFLSSYQNFFILSNNFFNQAKNISYTDSINYNKIRRSIVQELEPSCTKLKFEAWDYIVFLEKFRDQISENTNKSSIWSNFIITVFVLAFGTFLVNISYLIRRSIVQPINETRENLEKISKGEMPQLNTEDSHTEIGDMINSLVHLIENFKSMNIFAEKVAKGDFEVKANMFKEDSSVSIALTKMRDSLKESSEREKEKNWRNESLSKLYEILRNREYTEEMLYTQIISFVVKNTDAVQGGFFQLIDENNKPILELKASYAYGRAKLVTKTVNLTEGLLGAACLEKDMIYTKVVPKGYSFIKSGLGGEEPKCLVIMPLINNGNTEGALELGFFHEVEPKILNYIKDTCGVIASEIGLMRFNKKIKVLLTDAEYKAQEMKEQEEEMRQNMEELLATQEEMGKRSEDFNEFVNLVNASTIIIDLSAGGVIMNVNNKFCEFTGYTHNEIVGQPHTYYVPEEAIVNGSFEELWDELSKGKSIVKDVLRMKKNKTKFWLRASYLPVFNKQGKLKQITCICVDINEIKMAALANQ